MRAAAVAPLPAAYCAHCNTIFTYEGRDVFAGEVFCPRCASRVDAKHSDRPIAALRKLFPSATLYVPPLAAPPPR